MLKKNNGDPIDCSCRGINPDCARCDGKGFYFESNISRKLNILPVSFNKNQKTLDDERNEYASEEQMNFLHASKKEKSKILVTQLKRKGGSSSNSKKNPGNEVKLAPKPKKYIGKNVRKNKRVQYKSHSNKVNMNTWSETQLDKLKELKLKMKK